MELQKLLSWNKKKITLEELQDMYDCSHDYETLVHLVHMLLEDKVMQIVKASGLNGRKPALYREYRILAEQEKSPQILEELKYRLSPIMDNHYYINHYSAYLEDRKDVLQLSEFIKNHADELKISVSANERSFQIWHREKFLLGGGRKILKNTGLSPEYLNIYETSEPLAYYSVSKRLPQNLLILENKDPFYSIRKLMMENTYEGILGCRIDTVIYGAGKGILRSYQDYTLALEDYLTKPQNEILYFGDLDYEGIRIFEDLYERFRDVHVIHLFTAAYEKMLQKTENWDLSELPKTKEGQNSNIGSVFSGYFDKNQWGRICSILEAGRYIPQEILNRKDYGEQKDNGV